MSLDLFCCPVCHLSHKSSQPHLHHHRSPISTLSFYPIFSSFNWHQSPDFFPIINHVVNAPRLTSSSHIASDFPSNSDVSQEPQTLSIFQFFPRQITGFKTEDFSEILRRYRVTDVIALWWMAAQKRDKEISAECRVFSNKILFPQTNLTLLAS